MGQNKKPNFQPQGNKRSGKPQRDVLAGTPAKRQTKKTHHDSLKGNRGNGGGKGR